MFVICESHSTGTRQITNTGSVCGRVQARGGGPTVRRFRIRTGIFPCLNLTDPETVDVLSARNSGEICPAPNTTTTYARKVSQYVYL